MFGCNTHAPIGESRTAHARGTYNNSVGTTQAQAQRLSATRGCVRNKYRQNGNSLMGCAYIRVGGVNEPIR